MNDTSLNLHALISLGQKVISAASPEAQEELLLKYAEEFDAVVSSPEKLQALQQANRGLLQELETVHKGVMDLGERLRNETADSLRSLRQRFKGFGAYAGGRSGSKNTRRIG